ncbi:MAG: cytochrome b/b6 domain-containing protein [Roseococcus sp.]
MTEFYLILAALLAFTLNHSSRVLRVAGTLLAAAALAMIAWSIYLATQDGTFDAIPAGAAGLAPYKPLILTMQAGIAAGATVFLLWAAWRQALRPVPTPLPWRNTTELFGLMSRHLHWFIGVLMLVMLPMGVFTTLLPASHPARDAFLATRQTLGLLILLLVLLRLIWLRQSPAPPPPPASPREKLTARVTHLALYALLLGFPLLGLLITAWRGDPVEVFGWTLTGMLALHDDAAAAAGVLHNVVLPAIFYLAIALHLGAVLKHQTSPAGRGMVRRMLR